jgi:hypothetical protein
MVLPEGVQRAWDQTSACGPTHSTYEALAPHVASSASLKCVFCVRIEEMDYDAMKIHEAMRSFSDLRLSVYEATRSLSDVRPSIDEAMRSLSKFRPSILVLMEQGIQKS